MELKIYNKKFNGRHSDSGDIQIPLEDVNDVIFFKKWQDKRKNAVTKYDYLTDIQFEKITESGVFINCFPILSLNEDFVVIKYDYYTINNEAVLERTKKIINQSDKLKEPPYNCPNNGDVRVGDGCSYPNCLCEWSL